MQRDAADASPLIQCVSRKLHEAYVKAIHKEKTVSGICIFHTNAVYEVFSQRLKILLASSIYIAHVRSIISRHHNKSAYT